MKRLISQSFAYLGIALTVFPPGAALANGSLRSAQIESSEAVCHGKFFTNVIDPQSCAAREPYAENYAKACVDQDLITTRPYILENLLLVRTFWIDSFHRELSLMNRIDSRTPGYVERWNGFKLKWEGRWNSLKLHSYSDNNRQLSEGAFRHLENKKNPIDVYQNLRASNQGLMEIQLRGLLEAKKQIDDSYVAVSELTGIADMAEFSFLKASVLRALLETQHLRGIVLSEMKGDQKNTDLFLDQQRDLLEMQNPEFKVEPRLWKRASAIANRLSGGTEILAQSLFFPKSNGTSSDSVEDDAVLLNKKVALLNRALAGPFKSIDKNLKRGLDFVWSDFQKSFDEVALGLDHRFDRAIESPVELFEDSAVVADAIQTLEMPKAENERRFLGAYSCFRKQRALTLAGQSEKWMGFAGNIALIAGLVAMSAAATGGVALLVEAPAAVASTAAIVNLVAGSVALAIAVPMQAMSYSSVHEAYVRNQEDFFAGLVKASETRALGNAMVRANREMGFFIAFAVTGLMKVKTGLPALPSGASVIQRGVRSVVIASRQPLTVVAIANIMYEGQQKNALGIFTVFAFTAMGYRHIPEMRPVIRPPGAPASVQSAPLITVVVTP